MVFKTVIVTGASRGIGLAITTHLLNSTATTNVLALSRSTPPALSALATAHPTRLALLAADATDPGTPARALALVRDRFGVGAGAGTEQGLDGLVLNHGVLGDVARLADSRLEGWRSGFEVNVFSLVGFIEAALPALRRASGEGEGSDNGINGHVILTSSGAATGAQTGWGIYGASKAAANHLAMTLAREEGEHGVICVSVRPGMVDTEMQADLRDGLADKMGADGYRYVDAYHSGKLLRPEQPGNVMARLAIGASKELNGKFLTWNAPELAAYQD